MNFFTKLFLLGMLVSLNSIHAQTSENGWELLTQFDQEKNTEDVQKTSELAMKLRPEQEIAQLIIQLEAALKKIPQSSRGVVKSGIMTAVKAGSAITVCSLPMYYMFDVLEYLNADDSNALLMIAGGATIATLSSLGLYKIFDALDKCLFHDKPQEVEQVIKLLQEKLGTLNKASSDSIESENLEV